MKLSWQQAEYLILIGDHTTEDSYWVPPNGYKTSRSETMGRDLFVDGSGVAATLKALERKGLIEFMPVAKYSARITEAGRVLVERWRESGNWPVQVKV